MGPVYERLGVTVGVVQEGMAAEARREAYARDVTYVTAKEAGFDLLRDGLCLRLADQVHRWSLAESDHCAPLHGAIVDEADSILIDEARIPLVIAGAGAGEDGGLLPRLAEICAGSSAGRTSRPTSTRTTSSSPIAARSRSRPRSDEAAWSPPRT